MTDRPGDTIGEGEDDKLLDIAERTEREAKKWRGTSTYDALMKIAVQIRQNLARTASSTREA